METISTSVVKGAALSKKYEIIIYAPKGSRGAYIEKISKYPKQRELLLDKDVIFLPNIKTTEFDRIEGDSMKMTEEEKEAYEAYLDRISMPSKPRKLTPEEIEQLKKEGRI